MDTQKKKLTIGFYNPYFDSLGGGERYVLTIAEHWSKTHDVTIFWDDTGIKKLAEERFALDLSRVRTVPNVFRGHRLVKKLIESASYDLIFFLSDGSIPTTLAKHNILHFQVPFPHIPLSSWKSKRYDMIVVNSKFTKHAIDPMLSIPMDVIYPPVDIEGFTPKEKIKQILSVGRFSGLYAAKKQEVLIDAFIRLEKDEKFRGWKLVLAGGCLPTDEQYLATLRKKAEGHTIEFAVNCPYGTLKKLYEQSSLYWHAAGFGETKPEYMEHFGITTVESMAAGCIPIVYGGGGQPEIVQDGENGYTWQTVEELLSKTIHVIIISSKTNPMVTNAKKTIQQFSKDAFTRQFDLLLKRICG